LYNSAVLIALERYTLMALYQNGPWPKRPMQR